jgi:hypothetical protein
MKMWIVREHRGDNYVLFPLEKKPVQWEDEYWYQNGSRGIIISRWRYPELLFPKMKYNSPIEVELKLIQPENKRDK